jgi:PDZ domain-containing protein
MSTPSVPWGTSAPEAPPPPPPGPPAPEAGETPRKRVPLATKLFFVFAALALVVILVGFVVHVPYSTISPGATVKLNDQVQISGVKTYATPRGDIRLLFVREQDHVNLWQFLAAQFNSDTEVIKEKLVTQGRSPQQQQQQGLDEMQTSKDNAMKVALTAAGYHPTQIIVQQVSNDLPAGKLLKVGDELISADGKPLTSDGDLRGAIARHDVGQPVTLVVKRNGELVTVKVPVARSGSRKVIGVALDDRFSFPVTIDTRGIGGPSGGLAMTLAIYDDLTPGDLTGGKRVAVTGTIGEDGSVGEIGGIEQKAAAARAAGARLFIVPRCDEQADPPDALAACKKDLEKATKRAGSKVKVVPVSTFQEALQVLRDNGGDPPA